MKINAPEPRKNIMATIPTPFGDIEIGNVPFSGETNIEAAIKALLEPYN